MAKINGGYITNPLLTARDDPPVVLLIAWIMGLLIGRQVAPGALDVLMDLRRSTWVSSKQCIITCCIQAYCWWWKKSGEKTTWDVRITPVVNNGEKNWLAGFLNQQQYQQNIPKDVAAWKHWVNLYGTISIDSWKDQELLHPAVGVGEEGAEGAGCNLWGVWDEAPRTLHVSHLSAGICMESTTCYWVYVQSAPRIPWVVRLAACNRTSLCNLTPGTQTCQWMAE